MLSGILFFCFLVGSLLKPTSGLPSHANSCTANFSGGPRLHFPYCNVSLPYSVRIRDLISRMTYQEKCAALDTNNPAIPRLGLPSMQGGESTHGVLSGCGIAASGSTGCPTSFPSGTGLGASFNRDLWGQIGGVIGIEARGLNSQGFPGNATHPPQSGPSGLYFLDPNINLCRDPRWGRCQEVPGEDPTLTSEYAVALIAATQGTAGNKEPRYLLAASTAKHFSMYDLEGYVPRTDPQPSTPSGVCDTPGGCERFNFDMNPPKDQFESYYLRPFHAALTQAAPASIMCSYNAAFGKPNCGNGAVNNGIARQQWGWKGFIVSDCTALELMQDVKWDNCKPPYPSQGGHCTPDPFPGGHNYTHSVGDTVRAAMVQGGVDYNCGPLYKTNCYNSLEAGAVSHQDVDRAVSRVYRTYFQLGLLDPLDLQPFTRYGPQHVDSTHSRAIALQAARESIVLLKNEGALLPLKPSSGPAKPSSGRRTIAFLGPHANATLSLLSNYHGTNTLVMSHSPLNVATARARAGEIPYDVVTYAEGCRICDYAYGTNPGFPNEPCPPGKAGNASEIPAAVKLAAEADAAVLFVGLDQTSEAENFDRQELTLPGAQEELIARVLEAQPRTVVVLIHGGPIASEALKNNVPAVLDAFYPGELGGDAILDVLFGVYNPSGRLPYTVYHSNFTTRDIRVTDLRAEGGITHLYFDGPVLWPFGFGLSYTRFLYTNLRREGSVHPMDTLVKYSILVTNAGSLAGDITILLFARSALGSDVAMPRSRLLDFTKVHVAANAEMTVSLSTSADALKPFVGPVQITMGDVHDFESEVIDV